MIGLISAVVGFLITLFAGIIENDYLSFGYISGGWISIGAYGHPFAWKFDIFNMTIKIDYIAFIIDFLIITAIIYIILLVLDYAGIKIKKRLRRIK